MIKLLQTQVREVHLIIELPFSELQKLAKAISMGNFNFDGEIEEEKEAINYLTNTFYPFIVEIVESMKGKQNDSN